MLSPDPDLVQCPSCSEVFADNSLRLCPHCQHVYEPRHGPTFEIILPGDPDATPANIGQPRWLYGTGPQKF